MELQDGKPKYRREDMNGTTLAEALEQLGNLERALSTSRTIGLAMGMLMASYKLSTDDAFKELQASSQLTEKKLSVVAEFVVKTGTVPFTAREVEEVVYNGHPAGSNRTVSNPNRKMK